MRACVLQLSKLVSSVAAVGRLALAPAPLRAVRLTSVVARSYLTAPPQPVVYPAPRLRVAGPAPDFDAGAVIDGEIKSLKLSSYKGKWVVLFFYPKDFTFVCPTEIIAFSDRSDEFRKIGCEVVAASCDTPEVHLAWIRTTRKNGGLGLMRIPIVSDPTRSISNDYGVLLDEGIPLRGLFVIDPEGVVQQATVNNLPVGRSVDEALRLVQGYQYVAKHGEVCPAGWTPGQKTMIADPDKSQAYFQTVEEAAVPAGNVVAASSAEQVKSAVSSGKAVVVYHYSQTCGKCAQLAPFVSELSLKNPGVSFLKVDTSDPAFAAYGKASGVDAVPEVRFYKNGKQVGDAVIGYKKPLIAAGVKTVA